MVLPLVTACMITGKDDKRVIFARLIGLKNFNMQTYKNKQLIIINHGKTPIMLKPQDNVYEMMVEKGNMTLGDLRNLSLELVPLNALWYTHDDDDFRSPDYIQFMVDKLLETKSIAVFMKNRLEYNLANNFIFNSHFDKGNTHIMCIKLDRLRYINKDTLEDVNLQEDIRGFNKKYTAIDNDPKMYIRIIHQNNTSPYAVDSRTDVIEYSNDSYYKESEAKKEDKTYAEEIIKKHYGFFLYTK